MHFFIAARIRVFNTGYIITATEAKKTFNDLFIILEKQIAVALLPLLTLSSFSYCNIRYQRWGGGRSKN